MREAALTLLASTVREVVSRWAADRRLFSPV